MREVRKALWFGLLGSVIFLVGLPWSWNGDFFDADGEDALQVALVDDQRAEFAFSFGLLGLGALVAGAGLLMLGFAVAPIEAGERGDRHALAAKVAGVLGGVSAVAGLSRLLHALFATPEFLVDSWIDGVLYVVGPMVGLTISLLVFAFLAWGAQPVPKWTAVVLALGAVLGPITFASWYLGLAIFAVGNLIASRGPVEVPTAPAT